jgi:hypothetical protein
VLGYFISTTKNKKYDYMDEKVILEKTRKYLTDVSEIIRNTEQELDKDGSRFNIFSILGLSSYEVRLHSKLIAELLNPKGTHTFSSDFLSLFIDSLKKINKIGFHKALDNFDYTSAHIKVEKSIGLINYTYTCGGNIDIEITDKNGNRVIIENKIYAGDQKNQLLRYHNYDKNALLLYLTLEGISPSPQSIGNTEKHLFVDKDYFCISYNKFIINWLKECLILAKEKPRVKETISQYIHIIEEFTHQSYKHNMSKEIENLISENKEFYNSIGEIVISYNAFRESIKSKFWKKLEEKKLNRTIRINLINYNNVEIRSYIDEDPEGFFFGFQVFRDDKCIDCSGEEFKPLVEILKSITNEFKNNQYHIGWIFSKEFKGFSRNNEYIFHLKDEKEMDKLIEQIIHELNGLINSIENGFQNSLKMNFLS